MATPATVSIEPTLAAIRARWCINSSKTTQSFNDPASMEEVVEYLKGTYSALRKSVACAKLKILHLKQRMQNATNFLARLMSCKIRHPDRITVRLNQLKVPYHQIQVMVVTPTPSPKRFLLPSLLPLLIQ